MSESIGAGEPQEQPEEERPATAEAKPPVRRRLRGRGARWAVAGAAAVVVIGGGAAAAAFHHHHEEEGRGESKRVAAEGPAWGGGFRAVPGGRDGRDGMERRDGRIEDGKGGVPGKDGRVPSAGQAPAPLPSLSAADAVGKATAAVKDGKVESLAPVTEQGGGTAWRIVVVGPDGVRHVVTVDGAGGTVTGNTVLNG
ncbi:hypothetical protein [Streptomyces sp. NPDC127038]|uniref:hypothetical protein n=1 Tax=Streptomyces sp. NPDC127038 TaxID=3347114 RepID=UPI003665A709